MSVIKSESTDGVLETCMEVDPTRKGSVRPGKSRKSDDLIMNESLGVIPLGSEEGWV